MTDMTVNLYFKWFWEYSMKARERELKITKAFSRKWGISFLRQWLRGLEFSLVYSRHTESTHTRTQMGNLKYKHLLCEHKHTWVCRVQKKQNKQSYISPLAMSRCKTLMGQPPKLKKSQKACNTTFSCFTLKIFHSSPVMLQSRGQYG